MAKQDNFADQLEKRARSAIFWNALTRTESALIIAVTMVASAFLALPALLGRGPWLWALIALGAGAALRRKCR